MGNCRWTCGIGGIEGGGGAVRGDLTVTYPWIRSSFSLGVSSLSAIAMKERWSNEKRREGERPFTSNQIWIREREESEETQFNYGFI